MKQEPRPRHYLIWAGKLSESLDSSERAAACAVARRCWRGVLPMHPYLGAKDRHLRSSSRARSEHNSMRTGLSYLFVTMRLSNVAKNRLVEPDCA